MKILKAVVFTVLVSALSAAAAAPDAVISGFEGEVSLQRTGATSWEKAELNHGIFEGDTVRTDRNAFAEIRFSAGHTALLSESGSMLISAAVDDATLLELFSGQLRSKVGRLSKGEIYEVSTPQAVCAVRGTDFSVTASESDTLIEVYTGLVAAREIETGLSVEIPSGHFTQVSRGRAPSEPETIPETGSEDKHRGALPARELREAARREMFNEISRDAVLSRAAEEMKRAEYENRKSIIDQGGSRVRMEEYIVRPTDSDFKYVVLNHREGRFDFGKINFFFDAPLPEDLTLVTRNMFISDARPDWILNELVSVISNTKDRINEHSLDGDMLADSSGKWRHYFGESNFYIKGYGRDEIKLWTLQIDPAGVTSYESLSPGYSYYYGGQKPDSEVSRPSGDDAFHLRMKDTYTDGLWLSADDYIIDDSGRLQTRGDLAKEFDFSGGTGVSASYLSGLNIQRRYKSSEFGERDIDLVISTKLLLDSGMVNWIE